MSIAATSCCSSCLPFACALLVLEAIKSVVPRSRRSFRGPPAEAERGTWFQAIFPLPRPRRDSPEVGAEPRPEVEYAAHECDEKEPQADSEPEEESLEDPLNVNVTGKLVNAAPQTRWQEPELEVEPDLTSAALPDETETFNSCYSGFLDHDDKTDKYNEDRDAAQKSQPWHLDNSWDRWESHHSDQGNLDKREDVKDSDGFKMSKSGWWAKWSDAEWEQWSWQDSDLCETDKPDSEGMGWAESYGRIQQTKLRDAAWADLEDSDRSDRHLDEAQPSHHSDHSDHHTDHRRCPEAPERPRGPPLTQQQREWMDANKETRTGTRMNLRRRLKLKAAAAGDEAAGEAAAPGIEQEPVPVQPKKMPRVAARPLVTVSTSWEGGKQTTRYQM